MKISEKDKSVLRKLAERQAEIAALPIQKETIAEWKRLNGLKPGRPLVWINEMPWQELAKDEPELTLQTSGDFLREVEWRLRAMLYSWEHVRGDMVVEPVFYSLAVINETSLGIEEESEVISDAASGIRSRHFHPLITSEKDIAKIKMPEVSLDRMPFPGPALAARVIGEATPERIDLVRKATAITEKELAGVEAFQYLAILHHDKVTGMRDGKRDFGLQIEIRCWSSLDARTATPTRLPWEKLEQLAKRMTSEVPGVVSVTYNITTKPPSTMEAV